MTDSNTPCPTLAQAIGNLKVHDHLCLIYDDRRQQLEVILPFLCSGLDSGQRCIYIADDNSIQDIRNALSKQGVDVAQAEEKSQLIVTDKRETYLKEDRFDPDRMIEFLGKATEETLEAGFSALRVAGEMTWMLGGDPGTERLMEYEAKLNRFFRDTQSLAICQYNRSRLSADVILGAIETHPLVIYDGCICRNFHYIPPEEFLSEKTSDKRIERMLNTLLEREQIESRLKESERLHRLVLSTISDAVFITDDQGAFTFICPNVQTIFGYTREEVSEFETIFDLFGGNITDTSSLKHRQELQNIEWRVKRKDGGFRHLLINIKRVEIQNGTLLYTCRDITKRKRAEEELRLQSAVLDQIGDLVTATDLEGRITYVNQAVCEIVGRPREELIGQSIQIYGEDTEEGASQRDILEKTLRDGHWKGEVINYSRDGSRTVLDCHTWLIQDSGGRPLGLCGCSRDIGAVKEYQEDLRRTSEALQAVIDSAPDAIIVLDPQLKVQIWNPAAERIFGWSEQEIQGKEIPFISPESKADFVSHFEQVLEEISFRNIIRSCLRKDGSEAIVSKSIVPLHDQRAKVSGALLIVEDITEQRKTEAELKAREDQYRGIFDSTSDAILVFNTDGRIVSANRAACRLYGYTEKEIIGLEGHRIVDPNYRHLFAKFKDDVLHERLFQTESVDVRRSGETFPVEVRGTRFQYMGEPHLLAIVRDITEQKRAQQALATRLKYEEALAAASRALLSLEDSEQAIRLAMTQLLEATGAGRIYIFENFEDSVDGLCMRQTFEICAAGVKPEIDNPTLQHLPYRDGFEIIERELSQGGLVEGHVDSFPEEVRVMLESQSIHSILILPIFLGNRWFGFVGFDETHEKRTWAEDEVRLLRTGAEMIGTHLERKFAEKERLELERQIQYTQKLESLGVLAGGIAHDFNNILMAILGHADLALQDLSPLSPARENLSEIERASRRAADLCKQMLAYSGKGRFVVEDLDLTHLVEEMYHLLKTSITKKAELRLNLEPSLPSIRGDATQIRQIIMNLLTNASEALGERSGNISITTGSMHCDRKYLEETYLDEELDVGDYVFLEVSDTGCGMDKETLDRIFEPFFTTKFTGRGLGLAAVMGIVRGHRGALKVYTELDKGTTFKVLFPAIGRHTDSHTGILTEPTPWQGSGTILLVDDEEAIRALGQRMLERLGFEVITAVNGHEAVEIYRKRHEEISCVLLDLTMPHMNGEEAFRELRRIEPGVRVVLSSGYNQQDVTQRFAGKGLAGFIQKPYTTRALRDVLEKLFLK